MIPFETVKGRSNFRQIKCTGALLVIFLMLLSPLYAQTDSTPSEEEADTVVIYVDPHIINKTVVLDDADSFPPRESSFFISLSGGMLNYINYHDVCPDCVDYFELTKNTNKTRTGYIAGIDLMYRYKRFGLHGGVSYDLFRERFRFTESSGASFNSINKYSYLSAGLGTGLWTGNPESPIRCMLGADFRMSFLMKAKGQIPDLLSQSYAVDVNEPLEFKKIIPGVNISLKMLSRIAKSVFILSELSYSPDLASAVKNDGPYTIQRNTLLLKFGLAKGL